MLGLKEGARTNYYWALSVNPSSPDWHAGLAAMAAPEDNTALVADYLDDALGPVPNLAKIWRERGDVMRLLNNLTESTEGIGR